MTPVERLQEIVGRFAGTWYVGALQIDFAPGEGPVPRSELAMHTRIAGKTLDAVAVVYYREDNRETRPRWAYVLHGETFTDGLYAEVIPWEMRPRLDTPVVAT